jgi:hypothetical protein
VIVSIHGDGVRFCQKSRHRVRIRLIRLPDSGDLIGDFDFRRFRTGEIYDLSPNFASALLISGCAELAVTAPDSPTGQERPSASKLPEPEF